MIEIRHDVHIHRDPVEDRVRALEHAMEKLMAQIDDLNNDLAGTQTDMDTIKAYLTSQAAKLADLEAQLTQLQQTTPPQVDLSGAVAAAGNLKSEADAIVASLAPAATPASSSDPAAGNAASGSDATSSSGTASSGTDTSTSTDVTVSDTTTTDVTSTPPADGSQSPDVTP